jgi:hypothetical protein
MTDWPWQYDDKYELLGWEEDGAYHITERSGETDTVGVGETKVEALIDYGRQLKERRGGSDE